MLVIMTGHRMKVVAGDNKDAGDRDESEIDNPDSNKMSHGHLKHKPRAQWNDRK